MCDQNEDEIGWEDIFQDVQLSQAGALVAWSVGDDCALVCTDVTTCQILTSMDVPPRTPSIVPLPFWSLIRVSARLVPRLKTCGYCHFGFHVVVNVIVQDVADGRTSKHEQHLDFD